MYEAINLVGIATALALFVLEFLCVTSFIWVVRSIFVGPRRPAGFPIGPPVFVLDLYFC